MKLYFHPMSSNARRAHMAALHLGQPVELVLVDLAKGEQRQPAYLALNPNGKVPTLVDGDVTIWESLAIMTYLAEKTPGQTVYPLPLEQRIHVQKWLFWTAAHWNPACGSLTYENFLKRMFGQGDANPYAVERATTWFRDAARTLDATLATSRYVTGETLTLADLAVAAPLMMTAVAKLPLAGHAHVERWFGEIQALEAWKATEPQR